MLSEGVIGSTRCWERRCRGKVGKESSENGRQRAGCRSGVEISCQGLRWHASSEGRKEGATQTSWGERNWGVSALQG